MLSPYGYPKNGAVALISVRAHATTNILNLLTASTTIGGVLVKEGDVVLLSGQTNAAENGVYVVGKVYVAIAALSRHSEIDTVLASGGQIRVCLLGLAEQMVSTNSGPVAVGTDAVQFASTLPPVVGES
ncbi:MAG: hypothetical protein FWD57_06000 [Polyangiaceae bacterium]|nr:hypothetical protein [Polyangiaceae bacterium]